MVSNGVIALILRYSTVILSWSQISQHHC